MQDTTSNFVRAATGGSVDWMPPRVFADWLSDGYGAADSIDDLSGVAGPFTVVHAIDDGLPSDVTFLQAGAAAAVGLGLAAPDGTPPSRYWSRYNADSPYVAYERDVAPAKIDVGLITSAGPEFVRLYTGQMAQLSVKTGQANLSLLSATRLKLSQSVHPRPVVSSYPTYQGANATWPVSWALAQCGVYASPPLRADGVLWVPLHGSGAAFDPSTVDPNDLTNANVDLLVGNPVGVAGQRINSAATLVSSDPSWVAGPYVLGMDASADSAAHGYSGLFSDQTFTGGTLAFWSQSASRGRLEMWVRGDSTAVNSTPGGSGSYGSTYLVHFSILPTGSTTLDAGIRITDRKLTVIAFDGVRTLTATSTNPLPTDGAWHFCGFAWDVADNTVWVNLDGTANIAVSSPALTTANMPTSATHAAEFDIAGLTGWLPGAEIQLYAGSGADPSESAWGFDVGLEFTPGAVISPSEVELVGILEPSPREAFEFVGSFAQAEQAYTRIDENDVFLYLPRGYFTQATQQATAQELDTNRHASSLDIDADYTKIRNLVAVDYTLTRIDAIGGSAVDIVTVVALSPGVTRLQVGLDTTIWRGFTGALHNLTAAEVTAGASSSPGSSFFSAYSTSTGTGGVYATSTQVSATVVYWDMSTVIIDITNSTSTVWYLVNGSSVAGEDLPYLRFYANAVRQATDAVFASSSASVAIRGPRLLSAQLSALQTRADAVRYAQALVGDLAFPVDVLDAVTMFADPRRQPGDLVSFTDPKDTAVSGSWRTLQIEHRVNGADYQQVARMRRVLPVGEWGGIEGTIVNDLFTRASSAATWGSPAPLPVGVSYTLQGTVADFAINGAQGTIQPSATGSRRSARLDLGSSDQDQQIEMAMNATPASGTNSEGLLGRMTDTDNYLLARFQVSTTGTVTLFIDRRSGGVTANIASILTSLTHVNNAYKTLRFRIDGIYLWAKVWDTGTTEPADWTLDTTDEVVAPGTQGGPYGINNTAVTTHVFSYDNYIAGNTTLPGWDECVWGAEAL